MDMTTETSPLPKSAPWKGWGFVQIGLAIQFYLPMVIGIHYVYAAFIAPPIWENIGLNIFSIFFVLFWGYALIVLGVFYLAFDRDERSLRGVSVLAVREFSAGELVGGDFTMPPPLDHSGFFLLHRFFQAGEK